MSFIHSLVRSFGFVPCLVEESEETHHIIFALQELELETHMHTHTPAWEQFIGNREQSIVFSVLNHMDRKS